MSFNPFAPQPRPLPVPVEPFADETAASLASRAALEYARGDATTFLLDLGLRFDAVGLGDPDAARDLAIWLGADPGNLIDATPNIRSRGSPTLRGHAFCAYPAIPLSPRICPVCLTQDRAKGDAQEYLRTQWSMPAVGACPRHGVLLEPLPRPPSYRGAKDLHFCLSLWPERRPPDPQLVDTCGMDLAVQDFLTNGTDRVGPWSLAEVLATAPLLGCFVEIGPIWPHKLGSRELQKCTEAGFALLREGLSAVTEAVEGRVAKRLANGARSPQEVLGGLKGTLQHFYKEPSFRPFLDAMYTAAIRRMRTHKAQSFFGRTVPTFDHATIQTMAEAHGIHRALVRFALKADKVPLVAEITAFGKSYPVYDRAAANTAIAKMQGTVSHNVAMQLLGMNVLTFRKVWQTKLIHHDPLWPPRKGLLWRHEVEALLDALDAAAPLSSEVLGSEWVSLSEFSNRSRQGQATTARLLINGALAPACRCPKSHRWRAIRVLKHHIPLHRKPMPVPKDQEDTLKVVTLSQRYALRHVTITRLVAMGELPRAKQTKTDGRRMDGYPIAAVEQFFARYRSLRDIAEAHGCSFQLMEPLLARLGVRPLIDEPGHTKLYALADLPHPDRLAAEVENAKARNARFKKKTSAFRS